MTTRSDDELRQLAMDMVDGRVFTSDQIEPTQFASLVRMIFMPIGLVDQETIDTWKANQVIMFYEYLSKAGERAINGYPMFMSVNVVSKDEHDKLRELTQRYIALKKQFTNEAIGPDTDK